MAQDADLALPAIGTPESGKKPSPAVENLMYIHRMRCEERARCELAVFLFRFRSRQIQAFSCPFLIT
jgi:hypothetical protein